MGNSSVAAIIAFGALLAAPPAASAPTTCGALGGVIQSGDSCHVGFSAPEYSIDLTFPLNYPDEQPLLDYLSQTRAGFINVAQTPDARSRPYEMNVSSESFESAGTVSVVLTLFQDIGGAHPTTWYRSFTYDTGRGRSVNFENLFAVNAKPMDAIFPIVQRQLEAQTGLAGSISAGDGRDPTRYQNFAITDAAVVFFFGRGELLPSYAGATSVSVPRDEIPLLQI